MIRKWNIEFLTSGPVVAILFEGIHAISNVRMIVGGPTLPVFAPPGTIRGDYSIDSPVLANQAGRAVKNLVHKMKFLLTNERTRKSCFEVGVSTCPYAIFLASPCNPCKVSPCEANLNLPGVNLLLRQSRLLIG